jgi:hypothetical protein
MFLLHGAGKKACLRHQAGARFSVPASGKLDKQGVSRYIGY